LLADLFAEDAVAVTVRGAKLIGPQIRAFFRMALPKRMNEFARYEFESVLSIRTDVFVVHLTVRSADRDGNALASPHALPMYVVVRHGSDWKIVASQNTFVADEISASSIDYGERSDRKTDG
jgi:uncharacterized protein (TIGR02246 family)